MRGFKPDGLGPRECLNKNCDSNIDDALGVKILSARLEAEFPLGLPDEYGLSEDIYDIGNLWSLKKVNDNVLYEGVWRHAIGASIF